MRKPSRVRRAARLEAILKATLQLYVLHAIRTAGPEITQHACQHRQEHGSRLLELTILGLAEQQIASVVGLKSPQPAGIGEVEAVEVHVKTFYQLLVDSISSRFRLDLLVQAAERTERFVEELFQIDLSRMLAELPEGGFRTGDHYLLVIRARSIERFFVDLPVFRIFKPDVRSIINCRHGADLGVKRNSTLATAYQKRSASPTDDSNGVALQYPPLIVSRILDCLFWCAIVKKCVTNIRFCVGLVGCALLPTFFGGCASLRHQKIVPECITACREMSRKGVAAMEVGQWDLAQEILTEAVATSPTDIDARRHLAEVLWQTGARRDAVVHMEAAVKLDPRHAPTVVRSGEMLLAMGAENRAMQRAEQAIALDARLAGAWALRGRIFRHQGQSTRALADMQQALRFSPHATDVLLAMAEIQFEMGRLQQSLTTVHHLLDVYAPGEEPQQALWLEGLAYKALGRPDEAVESLYAASLRGAPRAELLYQLALAEQAAGRDTAAVSTVQQALAIDSQHQLSQILLANLQSDSPVNGGVMLR